MQIGYGYDDFEEFLEFPDGTTPEQVVEILVKHAPEAMRLAREDFQAHRALYAEDWPEEEVENWVRFSSGYLIEALAEIVTQREPGVKRFEPLELWVSSDWRYELDQDSAPDQAREDGLDWLARVIEAARTV